MISSPASTGKYCTSSLSSHVHHRSDWEGGGIHHGDVSNVAIHSEKKKTTNSPSSAAQMDGEGWRWRKSQQRSEGVPELTEVITSPHTPPAPATKHVLVTHFSRTELFLDNTRRTVQRWQMLLDLVEAKPQWNLATATVSTVASLKLCALRTLVCPLMTDDPNTINIFMCVNVMLLRRVYAPDPVRCSWNWKKKKAFIASSITYIHDGNIHILYIHLLQCKCWHEATLISTASWYMSDSLCQQKPGNLQEVRSCLTHTRDELDGFRDRGHPKTTPVSCSPSPQ